MPALGAPTLTVASAGDGEVSLVYAPPSGDYVDGEINYDDGVTALSTPVTVAGTYTVVGLTNGKLYSFTARARDSLSDWGSPSIVARAIPYAGNLVQATLLGVKERITALALDRADVFLGRFPKPSAQSKRVSINVYAGNIGKDGQPSTTGFQYWEFPVHVKVTLKQRDKLTGESQSPDLAWILFQIVETCNAKAADAFSVSLPNLFLTEASVEDIDTESGSNGSPASGQDQSISGSVTVTFAFWRAFS